MTEIYDGCEKFLKFDEPNVSCEREKLSELGPRSMNNVFEYQSIEYIKKYIYAHIEFYVKNNAEGSVIKIIVLEKRIV